MDSFVSLKSELKTPLTPTKAKLPMMTPQRCVSVHKNAKFAGLGRKRTRRGGRESPETNEETTVTVTQLISTKPGPLAKRARRVGQGSRSTIIIQAAMKSSQGRKRKMQDESILSLNFKVPGHSLPGPWSFAGVFDGHGGRTVSNQLKTSLLKDLKNEMKLQREGKIPEIISRAFQKLDKRICESDTNARCGSCAVVCLIHHPTLEAWVANVGDSRAILCRDGKVVPLSQQHTPSNEKELARIKRLGGFVLKNRINGELAVSRAFGDTQFKLDGGLTVIPDVRHVRFRPRDSFVLLGCDGLFDVMNGSEVVDFVCKSLGRNHSSELAVKTTCVNLVDHAVQNLRARDNVTAVLVRLVKMKTKPNTIVNTMTVSQRVVVE
ncbi:hypothetical protein AAMO2058_000187700 [Amorphochlora amoebiformis]